MNDLSFSDLLADDHNIEVETLKNGLISMRIHCEAPHEEHDILVYNDVFHPDAWDSLVYFSRQVLNYDKKIQKDSE